MVVNSLKVFSLIFTLMLIYDTINLNLDKSSFFWPSLRLSFVILKIFLRTKKRKIMISILLYVRLKMKHYHFFFNITSTKKKNSYFVSHFHTRKEEKIIIMTFKDTKSPTIFLQQHLKKEIRIRKFYYLMFFTPRYIKRNNGIKRTTT